jgi:hypothetical protein
MHVVLELGSRRTFARAPEWPGWCRSGRDDASALAALVDCRSRYATAVGETVPSGAPRVEESLKGTGVTDFGAPAVLASGDSKPWTVAERDRLLRRLAACWAAFDAALLAVPPRRRAEKPERGRSPDEIALHVLETELMHRAGAGGAGFRPPAPGDVAAQLAEARAGLLAALSSAPTDAAFQPVRKAGFDWTPRFVVLRSAWHSLDHAWELEDRA